MTTPNAAAQIETPPRMSRPHPITGYVRRNPFSILISAVVIVTGFLCGPFFGSFPDNLAAGPITTGQLGYWWTPLTALMIPDSIVEAVLFVLVALTVLAYAERLLGTVRTAVVFVVVGAIGVLLGVGIEALTAAWGDSTSLAGLSLVLDPATGAFAVIMAATAFAPALWRRRIRLIGFLFVVMFVLYVGDPDSVYRLMGALLGFALGALLSRSTVSSTWRRSSIHESRTLIASIVAVTGLGPLIALIAGGDQGPLGGVVLGFPAVDVDDIFARCADSATAACEADLALALTVGAGPLILSLVPLLLSLVAAWGLRLGRRAAWLLAVAVNIALALLTAVNLGGWALFTPDTAEAAAIAGVAFVAWSLAAIILPLAVAALLVVLRRRFTVRAPRSAVRRFVITVATAFVGLVGVHLGVSFARPDDFLFAPTAGDILADALRPFIPLGFLTGIPMNAIPIQGLALVSFQWVGVIFWTIVIVAFLLLFRATPSGRTSNEEVEFRALLRRGGGGTLGFMGTWPGNDYWFSENRDAAVAFRVISGVALTMSDPVCAPGAEEATIRAFVDHCDAQGWTTVFYSFHGRFLPVFASFGWQHMSVGEETVLALPGLDMAGKPWQKIRQALNKGGRAGITTVWSTWKDLPIALSSQIDAISEQWVAEKELPEMGFTLGGMDELKDDDVYLYLAVNPEGKVEAITSWLPSWTDGRVTGWTIDFMRRGDDSMPGIMEFVIASAALHMKDLGAEVMSLSGAPLATKPAGDDDEEPAAPTTMDRLLGWLGGVLEPAYGFTSLFTFKSKFNPQYETIYMAYADPAALPTIGLAIGKAYLPDVSAQEYLALVRTLTGRSSH